MKKTLLTLACACLAGSAIAQTTGATDYKGNQFTNLSANGTWLIESGLESLRVYNTETGKFSDYIGNEGESYAAGLGSRVVTNDGTVVGFSANGAVIFKNGQITPLPMLTGQGSTMNGANAITPDGKRIVGFLHNDGAEFGSAAMMTYPVIWNQKADGTYECKALPFPEKDFVGLEPQSVLATDISEDGKSIIIQMTSNDGFYVYPILLTENADGTWKQQLKGTSKLWDDAKLAEIGTAPVEPKRPKAFDYMTDEDLVNYNKALEEYAQAYEDYQNGLIGYDELPANPEYNQGEYITDPAKKAQYDADMEAYNLADAQYWDDYYTFQDKLAGATYGASYAYNNAMISANGKYLASSLQWSDIMTWTSTCTPIVITLDGDKETLKEADLKNNLTTSITNDGMLVHAAPFTEVTRSSYVLPANAEKSLGIDEWLKAQGRDDLKKFLDDNYRFTVEKMEIDDEGNQNVTTVADSLVSGTCFFTPDGKKMVSFIYDSYSGLYNFRSYTLDLNSKPAGIEDALANTEVEGEVIAREYFNLQGQRIAAPVSGLYLEKVTTTKGVFTFKRLK